MAKIKHVTETDECGIKSELFVITDTWTSYQDDPLLIGNSLTIAYIEEYDVWGGSKIDEYGDDWELSEDEVNKLRKMYSIDEKVLKLGYKPGYLEPSSSPL